MLCLYNLVWVVSILFPIFIHKLTVKKWKSVRKCLNDINNNDILVSIMAYWHHGSLLTPHCECYQKKCQKYFPRWKYFPQRILRDPFIVLNVSIVSVQCPVLVIDSSHNLSQELGCRGHVTYYNRKKDKGLHSDYILQ